MGDLESRTIPILPFFKQPKRRGTPLTTVIMPMAGAGSRFKQEGFTDPKPILPVLGRRMFSLTVSAIREEIPAAKFICLVQAEHIATAHIDQCIRDVVTDAEIIAVPELTRGSLETCLAAANAVSDMSAPLIVADCDLVVRSVGYFQQIRSISSGSGVDGGVLVSFQSNDPRYSYAELVGNQVIRTAEKQVISDHALAGFYGFASAEVFFETGRQIVAANEVSGNGEFYVSSVYNKLIAAGRQVTLAPCEDYWSFGTPAELANCLKLPKFIEFVKTLPAPSAEFASSLNPARRNCKVP